MSESAPDRRPTMADVARRAGVSKMTVSRVVNKRPGVAAETVARVQRAIRELNYFPSHRGRSLALGRSGLIGMIVLDVCSEWVWPLIQGAGQEAEQRGYQLLLCTTGGGEVGTFTVHQPLFSGDLVDGLIIVSWRVPLAYAQRLARGRFPVVLIDAFRRPQWADWVSSEDRAGACRAAQHLIHLGHRRVAFIGGGERAYLARERLAGFRQGVEQAGLDPQAVTVVHGDFSRQSGKREALRLLCAARPPTAILAASDLMAIGVLEAARELGIEVPRQLSVMGFDDISSASHVRPALTTVARPYHAMGVAAIQRALEICSTPLEARAPVQLDLPVSLVIRNSTGPAPG